MTKQSFRVLVIGGGIGGRAAAAYLRQSGHHVVLHAESSGTRAGVYLAANGARVLATLDRQVLTQGIPIEGLEVRDHQGEVVSTEDYRDAHTEGGGPVGLPRSVLESNLRADGVDEVANVSILSLSDDGVRSSHGDHDLLVVADGPGSELRRRWIGEEPFRTTSSTLFRFVTHATGAPRRVRILGNRALAIHYPISAIERYVSVVVAEAEADPTVLRDALGPAGALLLAGMVPETLQKTPLIEGLASPWYRGTVVLLGSAAHALHPTLGQSAAMSIEDARALQIALDRSASLAEALSCFEALRRERVTAVYYAGWEQAGATAKKSSLATAFRGLLHKVIPSLSPERKLDALLLGGGSLEQLLSHRPELAPLTPEAWNVLRFLVKIGQVDGRFDDTERAFARACLMETGHEVSSKDLEHLEVETRFRSTSDIVQPFQDRPIEDRERLIRMGVLLAAASGRVTADEHKALREAAAALQIPRETLDHLVKEAIEAQG
ncbi:MAG: TerB family tellurite resistance protein [Myxococcales bacterium]|nr:TerB family tellurite resistance protein [Polyangiaceae bacterium]MDW8251811.1 TerB family tellurite resistance protein [Myxococcales bacterium]